MYISIILFQGIYEYNLKQTHPKRSDMHELKYNNNNYYYFYHY